MVFFHSNAQKLHSWHMRAGSEHRREGKSEVKWEKTAQHSPTEPGANVRHQVETTEKRKLEILYCFWFIEDDTLLRFFQVFFPKQRKIAACKYFTSNSQEVVVSRPTQAHSWVSIIGYVFTGAFIKLQTYPSLTINHSGYMEYLILIYTKATKGSSNRYFFKHFCIAPVHLLHYHHFVKRSWNKWESYLEVIIN